MPVIVSILSCFEKPLLYTTLGLFRTFRAKLFCEENELLLDMLYKPISQESISQDNFHSTKSAEEPTLGMVSELVWTEKSILLFLRRPSAATVQCGFVGQDACVFVDSSIYTTLVSKR